MHLSWAMCAGGVRMDMRVSEAGDKELTHVELPSWQPSMDKPEAPQDMATTDKRPPSPRPHVKFALLLHSRPTL